jgi:very-short-patch-repair endonuclease
LKLAIEIDGASHELKDNYDFKRDSILKNMGINVIHFSDKEVKTNVYGVITTIKKWIWEQEKNTQSRQT